MRPHPEVGLNYGSIAGSSAGVNAPRTGHRGRARAFLGWRHAPAAFAARLPCPAPATAGRFAASDSGPGEVWLQRAQVRQTPRVPIQAATNAAPVKEGRLAVLDGLRGIAVLLVLWFHLWEISWLPAPFPALEFVPETGFVGVHLFFFISGFVIIYPFVRAQFAGRAAPTWRHFAYRRFIKIVPSYVLSIAVAIAIGYAHFASSGQAVRDIVTHLLFIHTWWYGTYGSINGVLWTLAVEAQFYLVFPVLWWFFKRAPWPTGGAMVAFALLWRNYAASCCLHTTGLLWFENFPGYIDVFACGMLSAYAYVCLRGRIAGLAAARTATLVALVGFAFLVALLQNMWAMRTVDQWSTVWQIDNRTWIGVAFFVIATASLLAAPSWQRAIGNPVLIFFATISYNLYLYHQMLARELLSHRIPPYATADPHADHQWQILYTIVAFGVTIAEATLVTYAFERPLLRLQPDRLLAAASRLRPHRALPPM